MKYLLDTNVILRFLVGDNKGQHAQAKEFFRRGENGKMEIVVKSLVIAEACFVLESFYKKSREEIAEVFEVFLSQKWLKVEERGTLLSLWPYYKDNHHFVDSYLLASASHEKTRILSFDRKLLRNTKAILKPKV